MTLKSQIASDVDDVFLDTDEFAEVFEYTPRGGVSRTITGTISDERIEFSKETHAKKRMKIVDVLFKNSATTGVDKPQPGDQFVRLNDTRVPPIVLMFDEVTEADDAAFLIRMHESPRNTRSGHSSNGTN